MQISLTTPFHAYAITRTAAAGPSTPPTYRGGVGISTASGAYQAAMQSKHQNTSAESHFLSTSSSSSSPSTFAKMSTNKELGMNSLADYRRTDPPMSLREYREKMALMDRNME